MGTYVIAQDLHSSVLNLSSLSIIGEEVYAAAQVRPEFVGQVTSDSLRDFLKTKIAGYKVRLS